MGFSLRFWGVRGSIACPSPEYMTYGGNTSCVEILAGDRRIILDGGTGIRSLGRALLREDARDAVVLFSHTHWDHINGFPFFEPAYQNGRTFRILAGHLSDAGGIRRALAGQMAQPMFPVPLDIMRAHLEFQDFRAGDRFSLEPGVAVRTAALNHPNGATGYRLEHSGKSLCYVTDTEHVPGRLDESVLGLIEGADAVIYDCTYTDATYPARAGWGHSTWEEGVRLCRRAGARRLLIFHHDPDNADERMAAIEAEALVQWDGCSVAREGMTVDLA
jgi:phosphoribosyl 1,2-cyclic phosphodiesterase